MLSWSSTGELVSTGPDMAQDVPCELQWRLRDSSRLMRLVLHGEAAEKFLGMSPEIPRLEYLALRGVGYTYADAEKLLGLLQSLRDMKVSSLPYALPGSPQCAYSPFLANL